MDLIQIIVLSLVQGLTEFLPVSSSAHLILVPYLVGWSDQGLAFDVAVHLGTLIAVVSYFRRELATMLIEWSGSIAGHGLSADAKLAWQVGLGTIPVGLAGLLFKDEIELYLRSPLVIATTTILFGLLLWWGDRVGKQQNGEYTMGWKAVVVVAFAQILALIPGTSRSGVTITAGLMMGMTRQGASRFSFLLSIPVILLAGGLEAKGLFEQEAALDWQALLLGTLFSALSAYLCIHYFLKLLDRVGMVPFVLYRLMLGVVLLGLYL
ncbi:MAG: undecaprenyl-diphosphate phosphatase [Gammaproteobacteria bacterium]|jgi:undecaprenyl-diphosphatase|nr:undecaprenyl-diphosphate phosphatase [Gammaproteobacteria bacterium]MBT3490099.1 undecaprenyl-diphosphate phosphatase [Gammaproteobacteria bacterium]MBT3718589.1 undecaprenyl-diphosphate phosphatase [Gammaproteobacteria bacterium]MBT3844375.1 undecaprenyl-diphosphate phosphatase [Gammaproteobacteria bacterium]MBT3892572.1 undecaprenyl-diphosphate phosphatase [Gammaproteobacteria bacterium]